MANTPHPNDDQSKKTPSSGATPKHPPIPNMSLDDDNSLFVDEVVEAEVVPTVHAAPKDAIPVVKAAPESDVVAAEAVDDSGDALADDEIVEEIVAAMPASDVLLSEELGHAAHAETPEPHAHLARPASDVKLGGGSPDSEVNLAELFGDAYASPSSDASAKKAPASTPAQPKAPATPTPADWSVLEDAAPASGVHEADEIEEVTEAEPASAVLAAEDDEIEEVTEAEPASAVLAAADDEIEEVAEAEPASAVLADEDDEIEEVAEAEPASAVLAAEDDEIEEVAEAEPASAVLAADDDEIEEVAEAEPASAVLAAEDDEIEEVAEAEPASAVLAADDDEIEEVAEAEPASAVLAADDEIEDVDEAEPASEVMEADDAEAADVLAGDEISADSPPSDMDSDAVVDDVIEEVEDAEPASAVLAEDDDDPFGATEFGEEDAPLKSSDSAVLAEEPARSGSSAVLFDEVGEDTGKRKKKTAAADSHKTVAFDTPPSRKRRKADPDSLVTEDEVIGADESASSVNLGDSSARKSSASGIDEIAEALESGVGLDSSELANTAPPEPSVEFDELLDEEEAAPKSSRKKKKAKAALEDAETQSIDDEVAEIFDLDDEPASSAKKSKAKIKATGDDIDLDDIFSEAEAAEALDADDSAEAEAAEDDAYAEAAGDDEDEGAPKKKAGAKGKIDDEDEEAAEAAEAADEDDEDEDEDASAKKKKGQAEKATVAPQAQGGSAAMRWAGRFFLLFMGMFLVVGALGAGLMFAGGDVTPLLFSLSDDAAKKQAAESIYKAKAPPPPPSVDPRTSIDKLREALAKGEYDEVAKELVSTTDPAELDLRGQAKWLAYRKQQAALKAPIDKTAVQLRDAKADLEKAKNDVLVAQIDAMIAARDSALEVEKLKTQETLILAEKDKADKAYDSIADVLVKGDYLKDKAMLDAPALGKIMQSLSQDRTALAAVNKVLADAKYKDGADGLKSLLLEKKAAEDNIASVNKVLENEKTKDPGDKGVLEIVAARNKANTDLTAMTKDRDDVLSTVKRAYDELVAGKLVTDPKADPRKELVNGTKQARLKAESPLATPLAQLGISLGNIATGTSKTVEQTFAMSKVFAELGFFRTREEFIQTPQQKLDTYIALLQDRKENDAKRLSAIIREAGWILTPDSKSTPEEQAKARYVQGLALRNQEKFAEAKIAFADTLMKVTALPIRADGWPRLARQSQRELIDPSAYYLPRAERLQSEGNLKAAVDEISTGIQAMPAEASLFAQRGLIRTEMARGRGAKVSEALQKEIRADADIASKTDAYKAESIFIIGQLEEELGNLTEAEKLYRSAMKTQGDIKSSIDDAGKYRIALGRLLLRDRTPTLAVPPPPPVEEKKGDAKKDDKIGAAASEERIIVMHPWTPMVVSALIAQPSADDADDKETLARLSETVKLANELIASGNPKIKGQGYLLLGVAHSKQGKRTDGLKEYSKGLQLLFPGIETAEMAKLINEHPAFQQAEPYGTANPVMAERHFGEGMHFYWSKDYAEAEKQFRQAVRYYDKDARYQYYLGLAQLGQKTRAKRDSAIYAFEVGARLEARTIATNPLAGRDINASLERIQGPIREYLNGFRYRASEAPEETKKGL